MGVQLSQVVVSIAIVNLLSVICTSRAQYTFCVVPEHGPNEVHTSEWAEPCTETKTWNEYLAKQYPYFDQVSNVTFLFRRGIHYMNRSLEVKNANGLRFSGSSPDDVILTSTVHGVSTPLIFTNFSNVTVEGMSIELCASIGVDEYGLLYFSNGANVTVQNVKLDNTCNGSEIYSEKTVDMSFFHINITKSKESFCGSFCLYPEISGTVNIVNSTFSISGSACSGSGIFTFLNFGPSLMSNTSVFLYSCRFTCANVLTINLAKTSTLVMNNVRASLHGCDLTSCDKKPLGVSRIRGNMGSLLILNSTFHGCLSAPVVITTVCVFISNSIFEYNTAIGNRFLNEPNNSSALGIYGYSNGTLSNVTFLNNGFNFASYVLPNSPALLVYESTIHIKDCKFSFNFGHALYSYLGSLSFSGYNIFSGNQGYEGSAMYVAETIITNLHGSITFISNVASYTGGAILINSKNPVCPFNFSSYYEDENGLSTSRRLNFIQNSASTAGNDIYGGYLDQAIVSEGNGTSTRCIAVIRQFSMLSNTLSSISSKPSRVCLCNSTPEPDCLEVFSSREAYPGEDITLLVVAVGQTFGTSAGFVYAQLLETNHTNFNSSSLGNGQQYQNVNRRSCNNLTITISSKHKLVTLVLTTTSELVQNYGNSEEVNASIEQYNNNNRSFVPKSLLNFPVYINITLKPCPSGFILSNNSFPECVCIARLLHIDGVKCHISRKQFERSGTVWIGNNEQNTSSSNRSAVVLFSRYCPNNYCNPAKVNIFNSSDLQCQMGHSGKVCGECPKGMSLTLGVSRCKNCSNENLYLIAPFALGGVALVIFIKVTDLTTAGGLINGLILYANLVKASGYVYFTTNSSYLVFLRVFIDWLNLDFGIETCFFNGLTGYWKTWLQFVFPIYIWTIALSMILLARYSMKIAHFLGNNSVPVLTTLFALSYAKLFRVIITAIKFTILEDAESGSKTTAWSYDGSVGYFDTHHSILLLVAVLVLLCLWLPYTCVLLFVQFLHRCGVRKISRFVSRMQPFLDAHCGPFKDKHRYWFGVLLVARAIPLLSGACSPTNSEMVTILSTIVVVGILLALQTRVYRKFYVSVSESLFLLNLLFLSGTTLYTSSVQSGREQEGFTAVLIGIAFLHFIAIVIFSTVKYLWKILYRRNWIPLLNNNVNTSDIDSFSYQRSHSDI